MPEQKVPTLQYTQHNIVTVDSIALEEVLNSLVERIKVLEQWVHDRQQGHGG